MTIKEAHEELQKLLPRSFCIEVEVWHHYYDQAPPEDEIKWSIYCGSSRSSVSASTLEAAVAQLRKGSIVEASESARAI